VLGPSVQAQNYALRPSRLFASHELLGERDLPLQRRQDAQTVERHAACVADQLGPGAHLSRGHTHTNQRTAVDCESGKGMGRTTQVRWTDRRIARQVGRQVATQVDQRRGGEAAGGTPRASGGRRLDSQICSGWRPTNVRLRECLLSSIPAFTSLRPRNIRDISR
jgi:hypothetical protein